MVKNLPAEWETGFNPWVGKIPWRNEWLPTPAFLPEEFHGQKSLEGYGPWGLKESDKTNTHKLCCRHCVKCFINISFNPLKILCVV